MKLKLEKMQEAVSALPPTPLLIQTVSTQTDAVTRTPASRVPTVDEMTSKEHADFLRLEMEMTPSGNASLGLWFPCPSNVPLVPELVAGLGNERQLASCEWETLLEQAECLQYSSPDIDTCLARQNLLTGDQELELTGGEFLDSPPIPTLPPLNMLACGLPGTVSLSELPQRSQMSAFPGEASRRPGLRARFPNQQSDVIPSQAQYTYNSGHKIKIKSKSKHTARSKRSGKSTCRATEGGSKENEPIRVANRMLQFDEGSQKSSKTARPGRSSWSGSDSRIEEPPHRRCSTARKTKNCMVPGCTKGARSRGLCKRHGGGKRCTEPGCTRSDQGGGFCIAHGGGKRCAIQDCKNSAQSRGLCKSHGGGKRCSMDGCAKSSQGGGLCRTHGSDKRRKILPQDIGSNADIEDYAF